MATWALSGQFNVAASREGQGWRLRLTPKSAMLAKAFQSLTLQGDRYVRQVEIVEANKDRTQIQFSALSEAPATLTADEARRFGEGAASNGPDRLRRWWHWLGIAWLVLLLVWVRSNGACGASSRGSTPTSSPAAGRA